MKHGKSVDFAGQWSGISRPPTKSGQPPSIHVAIATKVDPRAAVIGATIKTAAHIRAVTRKIIKAGSVTAVPDCASILPAWNAQVSGTGRVQPGR
jgi:hypothetical protein